MPALLSKTLVKDVMTRRPITMPATHSVHEAINRMYRYKVRHLVVIQGEKTVGMLSQRDAFQYLSRRFSQNPQGRVVGLVSDVMSRPVISISPDEPLREAARLMTTKRLGALPVLDERGRCVGLVTRHDLLRFMAENL